MDLILKQPVSTTDYLHELLHTLLASATAAIPSSDSASISSSDHSHVPSSVLCSRPLDPGTRFTYNIQLSDQIMTDHKPPTIPMFHLPSCVAVTLPGTSHHWWHNFLYAAQSAYMWTFSSMPQGDVHLSLRDLSHSFHEGIFVCYDENRCHFKDILYVVTRNEGIIRVLLR